MKRDISNELDALFLSARDSSNDRPESKCLSDKSIWAHMLLEETMSDEVACSPALDHLSECGRCRDRLVESHALYLAVTSLCLRLGAACERIGSIFRLPIPQARYALAAAADEQVRVLIEQKIDKNTNVKITREDGGETWLTLYARGKDAANALAFYVVESEDCDILAEGQIELLKSSEDTYLGRTRIDKVRPSDIYAVAGTVVPKN